MPKPPKESGSKKIVGLIGYPLGHSISPAMHNAAFKAKKLDYEYLLFSTEPDDLEDTIKSLRALHIAGVNVTVPYKEKVVPMLDDLTELAEVIGAVNTIKNENGRLVGYNTDAEGFIEDLKEKARIDPAGKKVLILGAGGAARAIAVIFARDKAAGICLTDINDEKAVNLAKYVGSYFDTKTTCLDLKSSEFQSQLDQSDILVNCTPVGMAPKVNVSPLPDNIKLHKNLIVYDLVYNPSETKLLKQAKKAKAKAISGLGMLVRQGALAFSVFTGEEAPYEVMLKAGKKIAL